MMKTQANGKIFLADERGLNKTDWFRSLNMFNFGKYFNEHKVPFGDLYLLKDDMLGGRRSMSMTIEENSYVIILPVAGAVSFKSENADAALVAAGQVLICTTGQNETIEISNPFANDVVNFLQIWIKTSPGKNKMHTGALTFDDVNKKENQFIKIFPGNVFAEDHGFSISIGKFSGRGDTIYKPKIKNSGSFLFVLNGAFEAEGRLLHERDGLALWDTNEIEMEALSNDAIILLIEVAI